MKQKEMGIYIHIPFCARKCFYCDFISYENCEPIITQYIEALKEEIKSTASKVSQDYLVTTIYIGGGTPSYIDSKYIVSIVNMIKENYIVKENAEITIEVNPGTVTSKKLENYKNVGINRLSIGLQTTNNKLLKQLGRIHTYEEFLDTFEMSRKIGFKNINVDLILAIPNQTNGILEESINKVIKLNPEHISVYSLILEEGTKLKELVEEGKLKLLDENLERDMYWKVKNILEQRGYRHYEISNFAKDGYESKHNTNCWDQKEYLGFGVSAHSYFNKVRYSNPDNFEEYINKRVSNINEVQTDIDEQKEFMLLGLRKIEGIKISEFKNKFVKNPVYIFREELNKLVKENLIEVDNDKIKLTNKGLDFANLVWEEFI